MSHVSASLVKMWQRFLSLLQPRDWQQSAVIVSHVVSSLHTNGGCSVGVLTTLIDEDKQCCVGQVDGHTVSLAICPVQALWVEFSRHEDIGVAP